MAAPMECPRIIIQCDWNEALRLNNGTAWVSLRKPGTATVYGELKTKGLSVDGTPYVVASDGFSVPDITKRAITVQYGDGGSYRCRFVSPLITFYTIHAEKKGVACVNMTTGGLAVSCDSDGGLKVWTPQNGEVRRTLEGHYGDVYTCRFFPSGVVILTGGADTQVKIWSAESGLCAATLTGHKAGVTDTAIVERGRNIVSCSRDGTAVLWDVSQQAAIHTFDDVESGLVNSCAVGDVSSTGVELGAPDAPPHEKEVGTEGKLLVLACENGTLHGYGLYTRKRIFSLSCGGPVNCCAFVSPTAVACGTHDGQLYVFDVRNTSVPLYHEKHSRGPILSILPYQQGFFATTGDGSCFLVSEDYSIPVELSGPDCDPAYCATTDGTYIYTSCRDGTIRKYNI